jgi:hypothetical protein
MDMTNEIADAISDKLAHKKPNVLEVNVYLSKDITPLYGFFV